MRSGTKPHKQSEREGEKRRRACQTDLPDSLRMKKTAAGNFSTLPPPPTTKTTVPTSRSQLKLFPHESFPFLAPPPPEKKGGKKKKEKRKKENSQRSIQHEDDYMCRGRDKKNRCNRWSVPDTERSHEGASGNWLCVCVLRSALVDRLRQHGITVRHCGRRE